MKSSISQITSEGLAMALNALAAESRSVLDAFQRHIQSIQARTNDPRILDATYEAQGIIMAMWPGGDDVAVCNDRWRDYGLTPLMSRVADMLHARMGRTVSRDSLCACWTMAGKDAPPPKDVDVVIMKIRRRIETSPYVINCEWGAGFRMELRPT
jgi:hypothetical protein